VVNETRAFLVYDVRLAGQTEASHVHMRPAVAISVSGNIVIADGAGQSERTLSRRNEWAFISGGTAHRILNRSDTDSYIVEVEVR
jgi:hypothetical protein